jgi:hypothetical protein
VGYTPTWRAGGGGGGLGGCGYCARQSALVLQGPPPPLNAARPEALPRPS